MTLSEAKTFVDWAQGTETFKSLIHRSSTPNALDTLSSLDGEKECQLSYAADVVLMLQEKLRQDSRVRSVQGSILAADRVTFSFSMTKYEAEG